MQDEFSEIMNHLSENARFALQKGDFYSKKYAREDARWESQGCKHWLFIQTSS